MFVMVDREEYWQCGLVIPKGAADEIRQRGIEPFREEIGNIQPFLRDRVGELRNWGDVSLLTVKVDRLRQWSRPGLLCIGDAAPQCPQSAGLNQFGDSGCGGYRECSGRKAGCWQSQRR